MIRPDGTKIVEFKDGTRITSFQEKLNPASDSETGEATGVGASLPSDIIQVSKLIHNFKLLPIKRTYSNSLWIERGGFHNLSLVLGWYSSKMLMGVKPLSFFSKYYQNPFGKYFCIVRQLKNVILCLKLISWTNICLTCSI